MTAAGATSFRDDINVRGRERAETEHIGEQAERGYRAAKVQMAGVGSQAGARPRRCVFRHRAQFDLGKPRLYLPHLRGRMPRQTRFARTRIRRCSALSARAQFTGDSRENPPANKRECSRTSIDPLTFPPSHTGKDSAPPGKSGTLFRSKRCESVYGFRSRSPKRAIAFSCGRTRG